MTETPEEMYKRLREDADNDTYSCIDAWKLLNHYRSQVQVLREIIDEYAGQHGLDAAEAATESDKWRE